jgi:hypothetical protein
MNERDDLNRAIAEFKAALLETQPFKAIYAAANWVLETLTKILGG